MILKCDAEGSIRKVRDAVSKFLGGEVIPDDPAKGESQSNGVVEEAGKTVREFVVLLKTQLEEKAGITIEPGDFLNQWIVRWAAMLLSRYMVGSDGMTGYELRRGRHRNIGCSYCRA